MESQLGPVLAEHQVVGHAALEVVLRDVAAVAHDIVVLVHAAHVLDHERLANAFVVEGETSLFRRRSLSWFAVEAVDGHHCCRTPRIGPGRRRPGSVEVEMPGVLLLEDFDDFCTFHTLFFDPEQTTSGHQLGWAIIDREVGG